MKKNIWIILCIAWTIYIGINIYDDLWHVNTNDDVYTSINGSSYDGVNDIVYVTDNLDNSGFIYSIDSDNNVISIFNANSYARSTFCDDVYYSNGHLYALIYGITDNDSGSIKAYTILEIDPLSMNALSHTGWFSLYENSTPSMFCKEDDFFYLSCVSRDESRAELYVMPTTELLSVSDNDDTNIRDVEAIRYSSMVEPSEGYHFVYAEYKDGSFSTMENGNGILNDNIFNSLVSERFENKHFTIKQFVSINKTYIIIGIFMVLAGILFIISMHFFVEKRNRIAYLIVTWEVMLFCFLTSFTAFCYVWNLSADQTNYSDFAALSTNYIRNELSDIERQYKSTKDYYRSEYYGEVVASLRDIVHKYGYGDVIENILIVTKEDEGLHIIASANGLDNCELGKVYGPIAVTYASSKKNDLIYNVGTEIIIDGVTYETNCFGNEEEVNPSTKIFLVLKSKIGDRNPSVITIVVAILAIIIFVLASIIGIYILLSQARDLRLLGNTMLEVSSGGIGIEKPKTLGEDMSDMWSGLFDIDRNMKNLSYIKYRTFEAYYKFAPKSVEKLLDKSSITEVENGDSVRKKGTIVLWSTNANNMLIGMANISKLSGRTNLGKEAKNVLDAISKYQDKDFLYKISSTSDFSEMQLLMPESTVDACSIGSELSKIYEGDGYGACIFMHFTSYLYGVAIAGDEASQYLLSSDIIEIRQNLKLLTELKLAQVITNTVYDREKEKPNSRYIGYWEMESGEKMDLYEILDAYDNDIRHRREDTRAIFAEGLKLFYERDFNHARNVFARVLKIDQDDTVARWYLFDAEKFLDANNSNVKLTLSE